MASLASFYTPPATNAVAMIDNTNHQADLARSTAGLATSRALRDYGQETVPGLINNAAAAGTFYGGMLGHQTDLAKQDVSDQTGDIQNALNQRLADLRRGGILSATGISL